MPGKVTDPGKSAKDNRLFVEAVLYIARSGCPWRSLPECYGKWNTIFKRFKRLADRGKWKEIFEALKEESSDEIIMIDSTIIRAHQHSAGAEKDKKKVKA